jgi:NAD(P)-dependent dehydrogenase (short-subunit alcohol dehydrogenase family)
MIIITGWRSQIAAEFREILSIQNVRHGKPCEPNFPLDAERYLFCQGLLRPKRMQDQTEEERAEGFEVNLDSIVRACDAVLAVNDNARICIIGSESAYKGSFDDVYAVSKMLIHSYVERKELKPRQQIVAISPGIIEDGGMTLRREDQDRLAQRRDAHPMKRFLMSREVAELAHHLLFHQPYIRNTVIRMHGGLK